MPVLEDLFWMSVLIDSDSLNFFSRFIIICIHATKYITIFAYIAACRDICIIMINFYLHGTPS